MFFFPINSWRIYLLTIVIQNFEGSLALPDIVSRGVGRSDLFLDDSFFIGSPPDAGAYEEIFGDALGHSQSFADMEQQGRIFVVGAPLDGSADSLSGRSLGDEASDGSGSDVNWPGRHNIVLKNAGSDVVKAFTKNLAVKFQETGALIEDAPTEAFTEAMDQCYKSCGIVEKKELVTRSKCVIYCASEGNKMLREIGNDIFYGAKTACHTTDTLYTRLDELQINNLQVFQKVMQLSQAEVRQSIPMNLPLRSALFRLAFELQSTLAPYGEINGLFQEVLKEPEATLQLEGKVLVGAHPGCSMVDIDKPVDKILEVLYKDPSLADYIVFQGYALFTAVTKYMDEFPTKKQFASVNQALDMMLGTSCGIYVYGLSGEMLNCDQYGGFPVLDMPVPEFLWDDEMKEECVKIRRSTLMKGGGSGGGGAAAGSGAPQPVEKEKATEKRRKRRSLMVGRKNGGNKRSKL